MGLEEDELENARQQRSVVCTTGKNISRLFYVDKRLLGNSIFTRGPLACSGADFFSLSAAGCLPVYFPLFDLALLFFSLSLSPSVQHPLVAIVCASPSLPFRARLRQRTSRT